MTRSTPWLLLLAIPGLALSGCMVRTAVPVGPPPPEPAYYQPGPEPGYQPQPTVMVEDQPTVFVPGAPPPPQREFIPMAPGPDHYWVRGYWNWGGFIVAVHLIAVTAIYWMTIVSIISAIDYFIGFWKKIDHASKDRRKSFVLSRRKGASTPAGSQ